MDFWFELASTYSYPAAVRIGRLCAAANVTLRWRPFLLGPIFAAQGFKTSPFNLFPARGRYMWRDVERCCAQEGLAFRKPSEFPRNSVLATRLALLAHDAPWGPDFTAAVYRANFVDDRAIDDPNVLAQILEELGQPAQELMARATDEAHKLRLRRQNEEAAALGIFGAPNCVVGDELFFGNDRIEQAIAWALRKGA